MPKNAEETNTVDAKPADEMDYKAAYFKEVENSKSQREKKQDALAELEKRDAAAKAAEQATADAELAKKGDVEAITKSLNARHEEINSGLQAKLDASGKAMQIMAVDNQITPLLAAAGVTNTRLAMLAIKLAGNQAVAEDVNGTIVVKIVDQAGTPVFAKNSTAPMGLDEFVAGWLETADGKALRPATGDSGSGTHNNGGAAGSVTLAELDRDPVKKGQFIEEHGQKAFYALVEKAKQT